MQKINLIFAIILLFLTSISICSQSNSWHGITPLHSTRADVERIFGKPKTDKNSPSQYKNENEEFSFGYISYKCENGWNVPKDTVGEIYILPKSITGKNPTDLKLNKSEFNIQRNDTFDSYWMNAEIGIAYYFSGWDELKYISYVPNKSNNNLRCNGFPLYAPDAYYFTMEEYSFYDQKQSYEETLNEINNHFGSLMLQLSYNKDYLGYIEVYFDHKLPYKKYKAHLAKIKELFNRRYSGSLNKAKVFFIEGGMREESVMNFYLIPKDSKPPAPRPTFPSPQFMRKN